MHINTAQTIIMRPIIVGDKSKYDFAFMSASLGSIMCNLNNSERPTTLCSELCTKLMKYGLFSPTFHCENCLGCTKLREARKIILFPTTLP
jgi:hypothetical protein